MRYVNGVPMGFALSAFINTDNKTENETCEKKPAIRFRNYKEAEKNNGGLDMAEFDVDDDCEVNVYINGNFEYGPIKGGCTITII